MTNWAITTLLSVLKMGSSPVLICQKLKVKVVQSCPTLCDPMDCNLPGSSVPGILQARTVEWVAVPFSMGSFQPRDWTQVSHNAGGFFTLWATREAPQNLSG